MDASCMAEFLLQSVGSRVRRATWRLHGSRLRNLSRLWAQSIIYRRQTLAAKPVQSNGLRRRQGALYPLAGCHSTGIAIGLRSSGPSRPNGVLQTKQANPTRVKQDPSGHAPGAAGVGGHGNPACCIGFRFIKHRSPGSAFFDHASWQTHGCPGTGKTCRGPATP